MPRCHRSPILCPLADVFIVIWLRFKCTHERKRARRLGPITTKEPKKRTRRGEETGLRWAWALANTHKTRTGQCQKPVCGGNNARSCRTGRKAGTRRTGKGTKRDSEEGGGGGPGGARGACSKGKDAKVARTTRAAAAAAAITITKAPKPTVELA